MRFIGYSPASIRGAKISWDVDVDITDELRRSIHPHQPAALRAGRLRRPFRVEPPKLGKRSRRALGQARQAEALTHEKAALVFAYPDERYFLIEAPE